MREKSAKGESPALITVDFSKKLNLQGEQGAAKAAAQVSTGEDNEATVAGGDGNRGGKKNRKKNKK